MINKKTSKHKTVLKSSLIIPLVFSALFLFCVKPEFEEKVYMNSVRVYSEPELIYDFESDAYGILSSKNVALNEAGEPFNGSKRHFDYQTNKLFSERTYENGYLKEILYHDKRASNTIQKEVITYEKGMPTAITSYNWNGELHSERKPVYKNGQYIGDQTYNKDHVLIYEVLFISFTDGLGSIKEWHPKGQLKFEAGYKQGMSYEGLMTSYDEFGNILEQELYEDGKLIEKIK